MKNRGHAFEDVVKGQLAALQAAFPDRVRVQSQFHVSLGSQREQGSEVIIDFLLEVEFEQEKQCYYLELQSRSKHGHELADKIEAIRHATKLMSFSFIHEGALEKSVEIELRARNIIPYDKLTFAIFLERIEMQLLQSRQATRLAEGGPRDAAEEGRLAEMVQRLAGMEKETRHLNCGPSAEKEQLFDEIAKEVMRDPAQALRQAMKYFGGR